ncbi:hypothetical protein [Methanolobus psychrotolerans]|uniref:hypothetical protein n=1 Tax=Methanolobus psychrotolerans TaxID=1874706 RepID=UPI000B916E23|nr:hypothetical protein [Methanolobus psychrotolerans]
MEYPTVKAKIIRIEEGSGYEGKIYDQDVIIELSNGKRIGLFDPDMSVSHDMLGKIKDITIYVIFATVEKLSKPEYCVQAAALTKGEYNDPSFGHIFFGKIEEVNDERHELFVDIGVGKIMVSPGQEEYKSFQTGDFVKVFASRTDLFRVYDWQL